MVYLKPVFFLYIHMFPLQSLLYKFCIIIFKI